MTEKTVTVNTPLAKTFGWLHVNGTHLLAGESAPENPDPERSGKAESGA